MFWINVDKAIPSYDEQLVKIKVADFTKNYITEGWYDHDKQEWYSVEGFCLNDNVYAWKHIYKWKIIRRWKLFCTVKTISCDERLKRMAEWQ